MESSNTSLSFSISSSSSSSLNLLDFDDKSMLKSDKSALFPQHSFPSTKKRGHDFGERFFFVEESDTKEHHYLESCFLCKKPISQDHELFMYRGYAAFCSENCRMDQMEMDESLETIARRQQIFATSSSSNCSATSSSSNCSVKNNSNDNPNNNGSLKRRPTIANLNSGSPLVAR